MKNLKQPWQNLKWTILIKTLNKKQHPTKRAESQKSDTGYGTIGSSYQCFPWLVSPLLICLSELYHLSVCRASTTFALETFLHQSSTLPAIENAQRGIYQVQKIKMVNLRFWCAHGTIEWIGLLLLFVYWVQCGNFSSMHRLCFALRWLNQQVSTLVLLNVSGHLIHS